MLEGVTGWHVIIATQLLVVTAVVSTLVFIVRSRLARARNRQQDPG